MTELENIVYNVRGCFDKLWSWKIRGNDTIEISTPYSTTSSKFVSLFLTIRQGKFVISDGGLLNSEAYESQIDYENQCLLKILYHYESYYEIKRTTDNIGIKHYYKSTNKEKLIPNMVYEMAQFISMCASAASVQFEDPKEIEERNNFRTKATSYISSTFTDYNLSFRAPLDKKDFRSVRFSAIVERKSRLNLINFVTGSNTGNFRNSIARANLNFEIASSSKYNDFIDNKLVLLNDTANGYMPNQLFKQIQILEEHTGRESVPWSKREKLLSLVN